MGELKKLLQGLIADFNNKNKSTDDETEISAVLSEHDEGLELNYVLYQSSTKYILRLFIPKDISRKVALIILDKNSNKPLFEEGIGNMKNRILSDDIQEIQKIILQRIQFFELDKLITHLRILFKSYEEEDSFVQIDNSVLPKTKTIFKNYDGKPISFELLEEFIRDASAKGAKIQGYGISPNKRIIFKMLDSDNEYFSSLKELLEHLHIRFNLAKKRNYT